MTEATIISGFPGVGKTHHYNLNKERILDSDSSGFSWIEPGVRHPDFPQNYIDHIRSHVTETDLIFVSSHKVVRDALVANGLHFVLVFPEAGLKDEYHKRFLDRGSPSDFILMIHANWDAFMADMAAQARCTIVRLKSGEFLSDCLREHMRAKP